MVFDEAGILVLEFLDLGQQFLAFVPGFFELTEQPLVRGTKLFKLGTLERSESSWGRRGRRSRRR